jgi:hypothetical protein
VAIDRALAAVMTVNEALERMSASGDLRDLNQAFKEARKADPNCNQRYFKNNVLNKLTAY